MDRCEVCKDEIGIGYHIRGKAVCDCCLQDETEELEKEIERLRGIIEANYSDDAIQAQNMRLREVCQQLLEGVDEYWATLPEGQKVVAKARAELLGYFT